MFNGDANEFRLTDRGWLWHGQVVAAPGKELRPVVALMASMGGQRIKTWTREGDVVTVTTEKKRPCRFKRSGR